MNEKYTLYLMMLRGICHEEHFRGEQRDFDALVEYGWIKPRNESGVASAEWIARQRKDTAFTDLELSWWYVLTAKGHHVLSPRENRVVSFSRQNAPNFDFSGQKGLHLCWRMYKRQKRTERAPERVLWLVRMLVDVWRPYSFGHDQRQIFRLKEYLDGSVEA